MEGIVAKAKGKKVAKKAAKKGNAKKKSALKKQLRKLEKYEKQCGRNLAKATKKADALKKKIDKL